jgi:hypothetical protein
VRVAEPADAVAEAAAELYALPPEDFIAGRTARVAELKRAGDADAAKAVGHLARPTAAASLVNRLVRERPDLVHGLLETGRELRRAQDELDAERLKALGAERRQRVAAAVEAAGAIGTAAGHAPGAAVVEDLGATFTAAVIDPASGGAVASGRLLRALPADGLEDAPAEDFVAVPEAPPMLAAAAPASRKAPKASKASEKPAERSDGHEDRVAAAARRDAGRAVADAERAKERAQRAARDAEDDLADADRRRDDADARVTDLRNRITELQQRLDAAEDDLRAADRDVRDRRGDERTARRAAEDAEDDLAAAKARLDGLG